MGANAIDEYLLILLANLIEEIDGNDDRQWKDQVMAMKRHMKV